MVSLLIALVVAAEPVPVEPVALVGLSQSDGCIDVELSLLDTLDGLLRGDFEAGARLVDEALSARFDEVSEKPYQRAQLLKELSKDKALLAKMARAKKQLGEATFCIDVKEAAVEFIAGQFRIGFGNLDVDDKLITASLLGNPENGPVLSIGAWKRVECWANDSYQKPCGPVFRDMPKELKAIVEDNRVRLRWKWKGLPRRTTGVSLVPWRAGFMKRKTDVLAVDHPFIEFVDGENVVWTAR